MDRYLHPKGAKFRAWQAFLLAKDGVSERHPFDPGLPVYFVKTRMFATLSQDGDALSTNLKCIPDWSIELRKEYKGIEPGYHMNKVHWNTVALDGSVPRALVKKLMDCSYDLVSGKLKKAALVEGKKVNPKRA